LKKWIKAQCPDPIKDWLVELRERFIDIHARKSYSQEGEDLVVERFVEQLECGFYVDIGAHHPKRFSNTYRLYCRGWKGLNIDATPGSMKRFDSVRPRDINVEAAVSAVPQELTFYLFNEPALNTFRKELAQARVGETYTIVDEITVQAKPLSQLLSEHLPADTRINLMTIDVEGADIEVLQSNNWERYSPDLILVECLGVATLHEVDSDPVAKFLHLHNYSMVAKTMNTALFKLQQ
jgi:FkbM family methyltransferase